MTPFTLHVPQGRLVAAQLSEIVTSPFVMIGARCPRPVQPVSRMLFAEVASPEKVTWVGQAHVQVPEHVNAALVFEALAHVPAAPALASQSSPTSTAPFPHDGVAVTVG